jgi:hypothetical protein
MSYFNTTFSHLKVRAIKYGVLTSLRQSIERRAACKGLEVKPSKVICVTYNEDFTSR